MYYSDKITSRLLLIFAVCLLGAPNAVAQAGEISAYESVRQSTDILIARLIEVQPIYTADPAKFFHEIETALDPHVDFEGFAKGVMAKHYRTATEEQRSAFRRTFRDALIKTYGKALAEFDNQEVVVIEPTKPQKKPDRAVIDLEIHAKSGKVYPVQYQLIRKDGRWLLRNVIINGINIGLQFRSQFASFMQRYKKDMTQVIENWNVDV